MSSPTLNFSLLYQNDLVKLREEIALFPTEALLWQVQGDVKNSAGNLCLHLIGNLNHFIGAQLGGTGYVRIRDAEFSKKDVPKVALLASIDAVSEVVNRTLSQLSSEKMNEQYPIEFLGRTLSTMELLVVIYAHLNYHLGQINYFRRLNS